MLDRDSHIAVDLDDRWKDAVASVVVDVPCMDYVG